MNELTDETSRPAIEEAPEGTTAPPAHRSSAWIWIGALLLAGGWAVTGWMLQQQLREADRGNAEWRESLESLRGEVDALDRELDASRERQRQIQDRIDASGSSVRVVREEVLAMSERATRVEEAVAALSQARQDAALDLRLDDLELLLQQAQLRGELLGDSGAAARALAHAATLLEQIDDPVYAALRVPLEAEREALAELGNDPLPALRQQVAGLLDILPSLDWKDTAEPLAADAPVLLRLFDQLVKVRRISDNQMALSPLERASRRAAIELALSLSLAALESGDEAAWRHHLKRARDDMAQLFDADSAAVGAALQILDEAIRQPLRVRHAAQGVTLRELRALRATRAAALPVRPSPADDAGVERP